MISRVCRENLMPLGKEVSKPGFKFHKACVDLPSPPMVMASDTPTVLYCQPSMPCLSTAPLTMFPNSRTTLERLVSLDLTTASSTIRIDGTHDGCYMDAHSQLLSCLVHHMAMGENQTYLHGFPSHQTVATPTCGAFFIMSRLGTPAPYSMAFSSHSSPSALLEYDILRQKTRHWKGGGVRKRDDQPGRQGNHDLG